MQSKITTLPSITVALPRWMSPWHSRMKPSALRCSNSALQAFEAAFGPGLQGVELQQVGLVAEEWANLFEVLSTGAMTLSGVPSVVFGRDFRRAEVELCSAIWSMCAGGQFAIGLQGAEHLALGNWRIFSAYSMTGPSPPSCGASALPVIGNTSGTGLGQALVQAQFFVAEMLALPQGW
jgi:hypothetical protein